jgi:hypothetical protein
MMKEQLHQIFYKFLQESILKPFQQESIDAADYLKFRTHIPFGLRGEDWF